MQPKISLLKCRDIKLCVGVAGDGPPLLFIGGTGWDLRSANTPIQSCLTDRFTVALFDQRGQGRSDKPAGPYSMQGYAEDALAVADTLGWDRFHVVGYSFGGMVAQEFAIRFPDRVNKLVLAATTPGGAGGSSFPVQTLLDLDPEERALKGLEVADLRFHALKRAAPDRALDQVKARMLSQTRFLDEPGARSGLQAQLAARALHDCYDRLPKITAETLVLAGSDDGQAPIEYQRRMADRIETSRFQTVGGSHNFIFEAEDGYHAMVNHLID